MKENEVNLKGLSTREVNEQIAKKLVNYDTQPKTKTTKEIITGNVFTYFNLLNIVLAASIILVGIFSDKLLYSLKNCLFLGVIICNTIISTIQEITSKKIIDKLSFLSETKTTVFRDSKKVEIANEEIVKDDLAYFKIGNQIPTDSVILEGEVEVNESFLTGEVIPVLKKKGDNLLSGSFIVSGSCYAKVVNVGKENYISKISSEARYNKEVNSVIKNSFDKLIKVLSILIVPVGILFMINQYSITGSLSESIFATVAALIGMIPEGLILLTSSVMAVSVIRLSKYKVLVQQLYCIETLARVNVICLDKTGTITEGKMKVKEVILEKGKSIADINAILGEICSASEEKNSTMEALSAYFPQKQEWNLLESLPFSSERKYSAYDFKDNGIYFLGAPEFVLKSNYKKYENQIKTYQENYRIILLASGNTNLKKPENVKPLAFILIEDIIRKNAKETLDYFKKQGVDIKIISVDNYKTVEKVAKNAGLENVYGVDASTLNNEEIKEAVKKYNVFGRVTPIQKKLIVNELKKQGKTVAMTGDGVNDVLALKEADCSIAMASGSDATRNVSQLVLLNSDFESIPHIVAEGRRTINNIERSASLLLVKTIFTILLILLCVILSSKYFFIPIQLTLITAFTIGIPSFVLAILIFVPSLYHDFL